MALQQLRTGTWSTGRGDWAELWVVLQPLVLHHTLAHAPTDYLVKSLRYWLHNRDCRSCGEGTPAEQVAAGLFRCENPTCPRFVLCDCLTCQEFETRYPGSPYVIRICSTPNRARLAVAFFGSEPVV